MICKLVIKKQLKKNITDWTLLLHFTSASHNKNAHCVDLALDLVQSWLRPVQSLNNYSEHSWCYVSVRAVKPLLSIKACSATVARLQNWQLFIIFIDKKLDTPRHLSLTAEQTCRRGAISLEHGGLVWELLNTLCCRGRSVDLPFTQRPGQMSHPVISSVGVRS